MKMMRMRFFVIAALFVCYFWVLIASIGFHVPRIEDLCY